MTLTKKDINIYIDNTITNIRKRFYVDGENEKYITKYKDFNHLIEEGGIYTLAKIAPHLTLEEVKYLEYPIITFDSSVMTEGHYFENDDMLECLQIAREYFTKK